MENRQLEASLQKLQEAANNNDMRPIWKYQSNIRMNTMRTQSSIEKKDGKDANEWEKCLKDGKNGQKNVSAKNTKT